MLEVQAPRVSGTINTQDNGGAAAPQKTADLADKPSPGAGQDKTGVQHYKGHEMEPVQTDFQVFLNRLNHKLKQIKNKGVAALSKMAAGVATAGINASTGSRAQVDFTRGWPMAADHGFNIDGPLNYNGYGRTVTITPTRLTVDWVQHVPGCADPGPENPRNGQANLRIDIEITDPATGEATVRVINRDAADDPNTEQDEREIANNNTAKVSQDPETGRTKVEYTDKAGKYHVIEFGPDGDEIDVDIDGHDHDVEPY